VILSPLIFNLFEKLNNIKKYAKETKIVADKKSLVSINSNDNEINIRIMTLDTRLARFEIDSEVLGISCTNIERNFD
tara:strand:+ start:257 stop:487 length:231 start_codon:yes stop_codon:yes gene_type:complete